MNYKKAIYIAVVLELSIILSAIVLFGFNINALQTATRYSGRLSLLVFSFIFLSQHKTEKLAPWLSDRPYLIFALIHGIHLIELLIFIYLSGGTLIPYRVAGGFIAYLLIFLMPVFNLYQKTGRISARQFILLETFFQYYVWLIFFLTYVTRVLGNAPISGGNYWEHVALLGWVTMMLGTKLVSLITFKTTK